MQTVCRQDEQNIGPASSAKHCKAGSGSCHLFTKYRNGKEAAILAQAKSSAGRPLAHCCQICSSRWGSQASIAQATCCRPKLDSAPEPLLGFFLQGLVSWLLSHPLQSLHASPRTVSQWLLDPFTLFNDHCIETAPALVFGTTEAQHLGMGVPDNPKARGLVMAAPLLVQGDQGAPHARGPPPCPSIAGGGRPHHVRTQQASVMQSVRAAAPSVANQNRLPPAPPPVPGLGSPLHMHAHHLSICKSALGQLMLGSGHARVAPPFSLRAAWS